MLQIQFSRSAYKFLTNMLQKKHLLQLKQKLEQLISEPYPADSKALKGSLKGKYRVDVGEYRIIYYINAQVLMIALIGKRNDAEAYKKIARK